MNKRGQVVGIGFIILAFVVIVVGLALYTGSLSPNVGQLTQTRNSFNQSFTVPANGGASQITNCEQKAISVILTNATSGAIVPSTNYTISQVVGSGNVLVAQLNSTGGVYASRSVNLSCNYEPYGYLSDGGSRGIALIIPVFFAIALLVAVIPSAREGFMDFIRG